MIVRIMTISRVCHPLGFPGSILRKLQFFRKTQNDPQVISGSNALSINTVESCSLLLTHYFCQSTSQFTCFQRFEPGFTVFASSAPRFRVLYLSLFSHWGFGSSWPFLFTLQLFWLCLQMSSANRFGYGHSLSLLQNAENFARSHWSPEYSWLLSRSSRDYRFSSVLSPRYLSIIESVYCCGDEFFDTEKSRGRVHSCGLSEG